MAKFDHFNLIGPIYDWVFGRSNNTKIIQLVDAAPGHALLDVGGGTGRVTINFASITSHAWIADSAMKMLRVAQEKSLTTVNASSERLPFREGSFDRIIIVDALHHVADQRVTVDELWRCLAPGGRLVIEEPDIHHWFVKLIALGEKLLLMRSKFLTTEDMRLMVNFADAESVEMQTDQGIAWVIIDKRDHED